MRARIARRAVATGRCGAGAPWQAWHAGSALGRTERCTSTRQVGLVQPTGRERVEGERRHRAKADQRFS